MASRTLSDIKGSFSNLGDFSKDLEMSQIPEWEVKPPINKVDTHHHFVPDFYSEAVEAAGGDPSGWKTPNWTPLSSELIMSRLGVQTSILSITAPGACILSGQASYDLARKMNVYAANLRDKKPEKFGFFASLPSLLDTDAALAELAYALDTLHADGVVVFTRYGKGNNYLGHPSIEPIWAELNRRKCVVFVHPTHPVDTNKVNPIMMQPLVDYPHETTRAAVDMMTMGTRTKYPDCKVILSHSGGTLPYLMSRIATPLKKAPIKTRGMTFDQFMREFRSFHFDITNASSPHVLKMLLQLVPPEQILYGSDFPYARGPAYEAFLEELEGFPMEDGLRRKINYENALKLIPRLAKYERLENKAGRISREKL